MVTVVRNRQSEFFAGSSKNKSMKFLYSVLKNKSTSAKDKIKVYFRDEFFSMKKDLSFVPDLAVEWNNTVIAIDVVDKNFSYSTDGYERVEECKENNIIYQMIVDSSSLDFMTEMMVHNLLRATQKPCIVTNGQLHQLAYVVDSQGCSSAYIVDNLEAIVAEENEIGLKKSFGLIIKKKSVPEVIVYDKHQDKEDEIQRFSDYDGKLLNNPIFWYPIYNQNGDISYEKVEILPFEDSKENQQEAISLIENNLGGKDLIEKIMKNVSYWKYYGYFRWVENGDIINISEFHASIRAHTMSCGATVHPSPIDCKKLLDYLSDKGVVSNTGIGNWKVEENHINFNPKELLDFIN